MQEQKSNNAMGTALIVVGTLVGLLLLVGVFVAANYVKYHDYANDTEVELSTALLANEAVRAEHYNKMKELVQIPAMYAKDLDKVWNTAIEGRYGDKGSQAVLQFITEHNPNLPPDMYQQIMRVTEAGRNEFANNQKHILDRKAVYLSNIGRMWSGFWIALANYPKMDLSKIQPIITLEVKQESETHLSVPLDLTP